MRIISFDASTSAIHLCLMEDGGIVAEKIIASANPARQELATSLLPAITDSLSEAHWDKASLCAVVVGQGPGSFTGIRGAVTVARSLAYALKLPLIGVSRFEATASYFRSQVGVVLPAYREHCYMSVLEVKPTGQTLSAMEPACITVSELAQALNEAAQATGAKHFIVDSGVQLNEGALNLNGTSEILLNPVPAIPNLATRQAEIAWNRLSLKTGSPDDIVTKDFPWKLVEPLYIREPSVTLKKS